jgi:ribulose-bisphosphate carboxylase small chain
VRLTQGCFSFLPDLLDQQIEKQVTLSLRLGNVEWTDDPHPRNNYKFKGLPLFDIKDPASVMFELKAVSHVQLATFRI